MRKPIDQAHYKHKRVHTNIDTKVLSFILLIHLFYIHIFQALQLFPEFEICYHHY